MINVENLSYSYGRTAILENISFRVEDGECLVITGENGSGKSTLLSLLSGAKKPKTGKIEMNGRPGLVPQGSSVFEDMTVKENLEFFAGLAGKKLAKIPFDLAKYKNVRASKLSGGYKKRLNVACTLVTGPDIWMFDEPCANLDSRWKAEMIRLVRSCKQRGCTVLYVGHDPGEFESFYDKILDIKTPDISGLK